MTSVSIVVPSYRRPDRLTRSLAALSRQSRSADEVIVVCRPDDRETYAVAGETAGVQRVHVHSRGVLAAMRAGALAASSECIGFVDDDAEAHHGWLAGILSHLANPAVGGVGGRDIVERRPEHVLTDDVGRITANGKLIGNHHLGAGTARSVEVLKAANMVFRRPALALPDGLRGDGAQVHFEIATSLWAVNQGWRLIYDPSLAVDHFAGPRFDDDARHTTSARATANAAFNFALCLGALRPELRRRRLVYGLLAGDKATPGLLRATRAVLERDRGVAARLLPSFRGQLAAYRQLHHREGPAIEMYSYPSPGLEVPWRGGCPQ
jgi:glycosyltransferase involved in cell wall biosynthesis